MRKSIFLITVVVLLIGCQQNQTDEAQVVIEWKHSHLTWNTLEALWKRLDP